MRWTGDAAHRQPTGAERGLDGGDEGDGGGRRMKKGWISRQIGWPSDVEPTPGRVRIRGLKKSLLGALLMGITFFVALIEVKRSEVLAAIAAGLDLAFFIFGLTGVVELIFGRTIDAIDNFWSARGDFLQCVYGLFMIVLFFGYLSIGVCIAGAAIVIFNIKI